MAEIELRIGITKQNKNRILPLIDELLDLDESATPILLAGSERSVAQIGNSDREVIERQTVGLLSVPSEVPNLPKYVLGKSSSPLRPTLVGSWGQFNSFFPVKSACRMIANCILQGRDESLRLDHFVQTSTSEFKKRNLGRYRGFPSTGKVTASGRYVWHFLTTGYEMGFITLKNEPGFKDSMPESLTDWNMYTVGISDAGFGLARLTNDLLDGASEVQLFSAEEADFILHHLKEIDSMGYREYTLLRDVYAFLEEGHNGKEDLRHWFEANTQFRDYVASWSRKIKSGSGDDESRQLSNLASTFASSKVALLRELRLVDNRRNKYEIIGQLE